MRKKHLWVLICSLLLIPTLGWSGERTDKDALEACLKNWGTHPFVEGNLAHRTIAPSVRVFGIGVSVVAICAAPPPVAHPTFTMAIPKMSGVERM